MIDGIGGTGVVTIGAILGMAAHLEGKGVGIIDMAGLAQKGGAVFTHMRIGRSPEAVSTISVSPGKADLVLGCDIVVTGNRKVLGAMRKDETVVSSTRPKSCRAISPGTATTGFRPTAWSPPFARRPGDEASFRRCGRIAEALFANSIAANMFMLGHRRPAGRTARLHGGDRRSNPAQRPGCAR
jgi:indolepyruvate ferredoxin oxidoreductase